MTDDEVLDALDGLMAYDQGATDSGIHDEALRGRVSEALEADDGAAGMRLLTRFVRERLLSDDAMAQGYGLEDVRALFEWLSDRMDYDV